MIYPQIRHETQALAPHLYRCGLRCRRRARRLCSPVQAAKPGYSRCATGHCRGHNRSQRALCGDGHLDGPHHLPVLPEAGAQRGCQLYRRWPKGTKDWTDPTTKKVQHNKPLYDGTTFHRVIPEFMIQGGDPAGTGMGDPGYKFDDEFDPNLNFDRPGRLAMANSGPNTNGSQFFITEQAYDSLNQHYTLFGQCDDASVAVVKTCPRATRRRRQAADAGGAEEGDHCARGPADAAAAVKPGQRSAVRLVSRNQQSERVPQVSIWRSDREQKIQEYFMALAAGTYAVFTTTEGKITVRLFEADAPITVKNFIELAEGKKEWTHPTTRAKSNGQALRRHHLPSRDSRLHDSGRRPGGQRHGRARLSL